MRFGWTARRAARHRSGVLALLSLIATFLGGAPGWAQTVRDVRVDEHAITVRFDARVAAASSFVLDGSRRIVLDLSGATPGRGGAASGPVAAIRQAATATGARIVFDLSAPAIVTRGTFDAAGRTLTLMLKAVAGDRFAAAVNAARLRFGTAPAVTLASSTMRIPAVATRAGTGRLPRIQGPAGRPLVVIDAGHGGFDPGALSADGRHREKDLTLATARAIRDELLASGRVRVALTRDDDRFLVLRDRYSLARRLGANLFISIHCDSAGNPDATGATAYTLSEVASDKEAARLAARENKADVIAGVDLGTATVDISSILIDLAQRETMNVSAGFAKLLGREARPLIPTKANFHRMASLMVLKAPDMPSILFETGYISNAADAAFLGSREGQAAIAQSVRRAVEIHFATRNLERTEMASAEQ